MGFILEFNCLLRIPGDEIDLNNMKEGDRYRLVKDGERLYPLNIAIEVCNANYEYFGKVVVRKLSLEKNKTSLEIEVLKVFSKEERAIFSSNFIKAD